MPGGVIPEQLLDITMMPDAGPIFFAIVIGVVLSAAVGWIVAGAYRRSMLRLMRRGTAPDDAAPGADIHAPADVFRTPGALDLTANVKARRRYLVAASALCVLIGLTQSWLALQFIYEIHPFSLNRLVVLGLVYAWPMVLAWGLLLRWSWMRMVAAVFSYMAVMAGIVMLTSNEQQALSDVGAWLFSVVAIPIGVSLLIGASGRIRAVAPYLLPLFVLLSATSVLTLAWLTGQLEHEPAWLASLVGTLGATSTLLLISLAPWCLLAWPTYALARRLAQAYRDKHFSDLGYLFAAYWMVILSASTLTGLQGAGWVGLTQLLPWLWIPVTARVLRLLPVTTAPPATLLVLRVFQQDKQIGLLFDRVVERWRLTGNTVLIAGTDLLTRTLDPDDLFTFINGRLGSRFIADTSQLAQRIDAFDLAPDPDGRYRVNECYCYDSTWQAALAALVKSADVVLMDLRGFQPHNLGCRHELRVLAAAPRLSHVVLLYDDRTARNVADDEITSAPTDRFTWVEARSLNTGKANAVLAALFGAPRHAP